MLSGIASYLFGSSTSEEPSVEETTPSLSDSHPTNDKAESPLLETRLADDEWILVEKSNDSAAHRMETSSMENLLIEHPSMSVYSHRGRQSSAGLESQHSGSSNDDDTDPVQTANHRSNRHRLGLARHEPPRRPNALATRVGITQVQAVISMQKSQQRKMYQNLSRNRILRSNKVMESKVQGRSHSLRHNMHQPSRRGIPANKQN